MRPFPGNEAHKFFSGPHNGGFGWGGGQTIHVEKVYVKRIGSTPVRGVLDCIPPRNVRSRANNYAAVDPGEAHPPKASTHRLDYLAVCAAETGLASVTHHYFRPPVGCMCICMEFACDMCHVMQVRQKAEQGGERGDCNSGLTSAYDENLIQADPSA